MTDPLRHDRPAAAVDVPERDRVARVEELLLIGLDHYFAGQLELAISVWTRVLFLDRGHPRARAYIERARSAISERLREGEELLHGGVAAFNRGDAASARRLLLSAVERGAASEEAVSLLDRLDRLEPARPADPVVPRAVLDASPVEANAAPARPAASRLAWIATGLVSGVAVAATAAWLWTGGHEWLSGETIAPPVPAARPKIDPLPVLSPAEASLGRAERLYGSGRLHDALDALEGIRHGDPLRPRADALRATIQRHLLDAAHAAQKPATEAPTGASRQ